MIALPGEGFAFAGGWRVSGVRAVFFHLLLLFDKSHCFPYRRSAGAGRFIRLSLYAEPEQVDAVENAAYYSY
jgi:hypothetical protein